MSYALPPRYLSRAGGTLKEPPPAVLPLLCCAECGAPLVLRSLGWSCADGWHGKLVPRGLMEGRVAEALAAQPGRHRSARHVLFVWRRAQAWLRRQGRR